MTPLTTSPIPVDGSRFINRNAVPVGRDSEDDVLGLDDKIWIVDSDSRFMGDCVGTVPFCDKFLNPILAKMPKIYQKKSNENKKNENES